MLRDRVAAWLAAMNDSTDVRPVELSFYEQTCQTWQGAVYTFQGEQRYYLIGKRPVKRDHICYKIAASKYDWYIGGFIEWSDDEPLADWKTHPFGNHWLLVPWIIEGEFNSKIDEYSDEPYTRLYIDVEG